MIIQKSSFLRLNTCRRRRARLARSLSLALFLGGAIAVNNAGAQDRAPESLECDVQFEVQNFLKDSYLLQPSKDLPASVPTAASGQKPFGSYRLDIDWKTRTALIHSTLASVGSSVAAGPRTYAITSDPAADVIQLEAGERAKMDVFPSRFFIRRVSGWFMRLEPMSSKPTTGFTEVGVCGRDQKF